MAARSGRSSHDATLAAAARQSSAIIRAGELRGKLGRSRRSERVEALANACMHRYRGRAKIIGAIMKWEYRVEAFAFDDPAQCQQMLNEMGGDGWEAVALVPYAFRQEEAWAAVILKRALAGRNSD